jgi:glycosyltransferase involved in cell wall biosynthesis
MVSGNGAYIVHANLARAIPGYTLQGISAMKAVYPGLLKPYRRQAEIVHTVPEYGDVFFSMAKKSVVTFHNFFWDAAYRPYCSFAQSIFYRFLQEGYVRRAIEKADAVVAVSEYTAGLVRACYPEVDVQVILNGVDTKRFSPGKNKPDAQLNILFSGNPTRRKGRHVLKAVAESLPEHVTLLVTGGLRKEDGDLRHPRIRFVGHIPYENMPDIYRKADILLLPSYREGLSLSALEGMASGLPVVSYDSSSMSELVVHGSGGYLSPVDDIKGIVTSISNLISAPNSLTEMGMFNRKRVIEHFDQQRMVAEYAALFHSM